MSTEVISIRYDGLDAERHELDLHALGDSLKGIARILGVAGHFAQTGQYAKQMQALDVRVYVAEPRANCFSIDAVVQFAKDQQILAGMGTTALALFGSVVAWIFARARRDKEEMKALKSSLDKAISELAGQNKEIIPRMLDTVERMAESLRPAARDAVAPVGKSCTDMRIGNYTKIDRLGAEVIRSTDADEITDERDWSIRITELDLETHSARIRFVEDGEQDERRYRATITDPALDVLNNRYIRAFSSGRHLIVRGKASLRDGEVANLYISDSKDAGQDKA